MQINSSFLSILRLSSRGGTTSLDTTCIRVSKGESALWGGFPLKTFHVKLVGQVAAQDHFESNFTTKLFVPGAINHAHATASNFVE